MCPLPPWQDPPPSAQTIGAAIKALPNAKPRTTGVLHAIWSSSFLCRYTALSPSRIVRRKGYTEVDDGAFFDESNAGISDTCADTRLMSPTWFQTRPHYRMIITRMTSERWP